MLAGLAAYLGLQCFLPLRHFLVPGNVHWTEEGHRFAWHMKLRTKEGLLWYRLTSPRSGATWTVDPRDELTSWQARKMIGRPDMILEYAWHLAERARATRDRTAAMEAMQGLDRLYRSRAALASARAEAAAKAQDVLDGDPLIDLAERSLMAPLDAAAEAEVTPGMIS